ncbi:hypothetical protein AX14_014436 [Amanita brunnescens Koide BX004]|nr:hypothetical protein AX14_014436 [Amanita brunnescens Koide BX004]
MALQSPTLARRISIPARCATSSTRMHRPPRITLQITAIPRLPAISNTHAPDLDPARPQAEASDLLQPLPRVERELYQPSPATRQTAGDRYTPELLQQQQQRQRPQPARRRVRVLQPSVSVFPPGVHTNTRH